MWEFLKKIKDSIPNVDRFWVQNEVGSGDCEWQIAGKVFGFNQFTERFGEGLNKDNFIDKMKEAIASLPVDNSFRLDENSRLKFKTQIVQDQTSKFWDFCKYSQDHFNDGSSRVIPDSVQEFSQVFFEGLEKVLKSI